MIMMRTLRRDLNRYNAEEKEELQEVRLLLSRCAAWRGARDIGQRCDARSNARHVCGLRWAGVSSGAA